MEFAAPGVYVLRTPEYSALGQQMVSHWLLHNIQPPCVGCLWLTQASPNSVRLFLDTILSNHRKGPKGLDILCLNPLPENPQYPNNTPNNTPDNIQELCRALNTLTVLKPALLVLEEAQRWLGQAQYIASKPSKKNRESANTPFNHMQLLQRWADHANVRVLLPWQGPLPQWCTFATGFAEVNAQGDWVFAPWWPSEQGMQSMLWNESRSATTHLLLHASHFPNLQTLGLMVYRLRFFGHNPGRIYILNNTHINPLNATALLRLGADEVLHNTHHLPEQTHTLLPAEADLQLATTEPELANAFAKDLHELWMPGHLRCIHAPHFAQNSQTTLQLMGGWDLSGQIIRLSLRKHIHAQMAIQRLNSGTAGAMVCPTREALYIFKLWATPPTAHAFEAWLQACFYEPLETLFSGHIVIKNSKQVDLILASLSQEFSIEFDEEYTNADIQGPALPELWQGSTATSQQERPWLQRLEQHFQGNPS